MNSPALESPANRRLPDVTVVGDADAIAECAARRVVEILQSAIAQRGTATVALSGGATPRALYRKLVSDHPDAVRWSAVHWCFGDERCVLPDEASSNFKLAMDEFILPLQIPAVCVHRIHGELAPPAAAQAYEDTLRHLFDKTANDAFPAFDLILLGMGADGHTASLFPGTPALEARSRWVTVGRAPVEPFDRVTLTFPMINTARAVLILAGGDEKLPAMQRWLAQSTSLNETPISGVSPDAQASFELVTDNDPRAA